MNRTCEPASTISYRIERVDQSGYTDLEQIRLVHLDGGTTEWFEVDLESDLGCDCD